MCPTIHGLLPEGGYSFKSASGGTEISPLQSPLPCPSSALRYTSAFPNMISSCLGASGVSSETGAHARRAGRNLRGRAPLRVGGRCNKQGNLHTRLVLGGRHDESFSTLIFQVHIQALTGSHIQPRQSIQPLLASQARVLKPLLGVTARWVQVPSVGEEVGSLPLPAPGPNPSVSMTVSSRSLGASWRSGAEHLGQSWLQRSVPLRTLLEQVIYYL